MELPGRSASVVAIGIVFGVLTAPQLVRAQEREVVSDERESRPRARTTDATPPRAPERDAPRAPEATAPSPAEATPRQPRAPETRRGAPEPELRDEGEPGERVDLFPDEVLGPAVGWELRSAPAPGSLEESSEEVLDRWMDDRLRDEQIGAGRVDGWYYAMRESMRSSFRPDRGAMEAERRATMDPLEIAADELGRYAQRPQRTMDPGGHAPQTIFSRSREDEATQSRFDERSPLYAPITWYRVELRVVQNRNGSVATVHVTRTSGMPSMDRAAIEAIRGGTIRLAVPPPSVLGARETITSEWAFEVGDVATRIDTLGAVESVDGEMQVGALGRGVVRTSVQLLRVIDAEHPSFDERRETRRERRSRREPRAR